MRLWDILMVGFLILGISALVIILTIAWTWAIWWALTFFKIISMPYTWEFAFAVLILSSLFGGAIRINKRG